MQLDLEIDDVESEVRRLEAPGASRWDHQQERGWDFCVPELLAKRPPWPEATPEAHD